MTNEAGPLMQILTLLHKSQLAQLNESQLEAADSIAKQFLDMRQRIAELKLQLAACEQSRDWHNAHRESARAEERERCALHCEHVKMMLGSIAGENAKRAAQTCADEIRALGNE